MDALRIFLTGIIIGIANVIPGVSGSTMAVVFNIYDRFVNAVTLNVKKLWENRAFVAPVVSGMAVGVLFFSKLISFLYDGYPLQTNFFFTGLIAGSFPLLVSLTLKKSEDEESLSALKKTAVIICFLAGLFIILLTAYLEGDASSSREIPGELPALTASLSVLLFAGGVLGAAGMIVPGISGSLLMLMIGVYPVIMKAVSSLFVKESLVPAFLILMIAGLGVLTGLLCGALLIKTLIKNVPNQSYALITGLLAGSVVHIFPGLSSFEGALQAVICVLCLTAGFLAAYISTKLSR